MTPKQLRRLNLLWQLHQAGALQLYVTLTRERAIKRILEEALG